MKVLVIFDFIPEEQKRAVVEMSEEEYKVFSKAHNFIINANEGAGYEEALVISWAFSKLTPEGHCSDLEKKYAGKWVCNLDSEISDLSGVDKLICTGFYL